MTTQIPSVQVRQMSKSKKLFGRLQQRETVSNHKKYFPDSFVYRRGDHPYGTREYLLVRPKKNDDAYSNDVDTNTPTTTEPFPPDLLLLATLHANNGIVFGSSINTKVVQKATRQQQQQQPHDENDTTATTSFPSILDLCPILLHSALMDCANEGEQPQALSTLHGLSSWVRQCLDEGNNNNIYSNVIRTLQEQIKNPTTTQNIVGRHRLVDTNDARQQLDCITAIATNVPRAGHSVVGQKTHADGAHGWEALAREYALLDYYHYNTNSRSSSNDDTSTNDETSTKTETTNHNTATSPVLLQLSEECLLYRQYSEHCELGDIELLADTSPTYLSSAGGAMARFFVN